MKNVIFKVSRPDYSVNFDLNELELMYDVLCESGWKDNDPESDKSVSTGIMNKLYNLIEV
jgi:hypothetical protein